MKRKRAKKVATKKDATKYIVEVAVTISGSVTKKWVKELVIGQLHTLRNVAKVRVRKIDAD